MPLTLLSTAAALIAVSMLVMTVQGDLKDLHEEEPCIPRALGAFTDGHRLYMGPSFSLFYLSMVFLQMTLMILLAPEGMITVLVIIISLSLLAPTGAIILEVSYNPGYIKKNIVIHTVVAAVGTLVALGSAMDYLSIGLLVIASLVWGFGWLKILFGDSFWFA